MSRWARARALVRDRYLTVDPRSAALFRVVIAALLVADLVRHWREIGFLYSNDGVLSNHLHLYRPGSRFMFSLFDAFSTPAEVHVLFALGLAAHLCLLVGWRTRWAAVLSFLWVTSRDSRIPLVENGGYVVENLCCFWLCFLPIERRLSIDAWRRSWAAHKETTVAALSERVPATARNAKLRSLAGLTVIANLTVIYLFNVINKTGHIWRHGDTVHYVLHIDRMVTGLGVFVREHVPERVLALADYGTLVVEAVICVSIATPFARKVARPLAMALMLLLHGTFGTFMRLGPFSWFMIGWSTFLLLPIHFGAAARFYAARSRGCELILPPDSPFALALGRVVKRLDHLERVTFVAGAEGDALAARATGATERETAPARILAIVTDALPFGRWIARALGVATLGLAPLLARRALASPTPIERWLGLTLSPAPAAAPAPPLSERLWRGARFVREAFLFYFAVTASYQVFVENRIIPKTLPPPLKEGQTLQPDEQRAYDFVKSLLGDRVITLKPDPPDFMAATITYPRLFQGWGMFAPNPIVEDGILVVDGYTVDGRRLDPLTGGDPLLSIQDLRGAGLSQLRQDYGNRIRSDRNQPYREGLKDYLQRWHLSTGRPQDELIAFDVYWVRDKCPEPGKDRPGPSDPVPLLTWRGEKAKRPPPGLKIPAPPRLRSAEVWTR